LLKYLIVASFKYRIQITVSLLLQICFHQISHAFP